MFENVTIEEYQGMEKQEYKSNGSEQTYDDL